MNSVEYTLARGVEDQAKLQPGDRVRFLSDVDTVYRITRKSDGYTYAESAMGSVNLPELYLAMASGQYEINRAGQGAELEDEDLVQELLGWTLQVLELVKEITEHGADQTQREVWVGEVAGSMRELAESVTW